VEEIKIFHRKVYQKIKRENIKHYQNFLKKTWLIVYLKTKPNKRNNKKNHIFQIINF
jgi:sRNA-binding carbon storage regulator CsrA